MIITKKAYNKLSASDKQLLMYSNPCTFGRNFAGKKLIRVGEVFDSYLGCWRDADESDF